MNPLNKATKLRRKTSPKARKMTQEIEDAIFHCEKMQGLVFIREQALLAALKAGGAAGFDLTFGTDAKRFIIEQAMADLEQAHFQLDAADRKRNELNAQ
jgi:hypothetical protein